MQLSSIFAAALAGKAVMAHGDLRCGAPAPSPRHLAMAKQLAAQEAAAASSFSIMKAPELINITVHWNTIAFNDTLDGGYVNASVVEEQMSILNRVYPEYGITFTLGSSNVVINETWAGALEYDVILEMKTVLRQGGYSELNMYTLPGLDESGLLGQAIPPEANVTKGSEIWNLDGVIIASGSMTSGKLEHYNEGYTAVHEIGHWLGLWHTFEGGCEGDGDFVDDTPSEKIPSKGCPVGRNTCPDRPGVDPIHNYMDYSYDSCFTEFTRGQAVRMQSSWKAYRDGR